MTPEQEKRFRFQAQLEQDLKTAEKQVYEATGDWPAGHPEAPEYTGPVYTRVSEEPPSQSDASWWASQNPLQKSLNLGVNVASGVRTGILDILDMPANLYNLGQAGLKATGVVDDDARPAVGITQIQPDINPLNWLRGKGRPIPKGVSKIADATHTGATWLGGGVLPVSGALRIADKALKAPSIATKTAATASPAVAAVKPEVYAAAGATIGDYSDIPYADVVLGLAGGLKGGAPQTPKLDKADKAAVNLVTKNLRASTPDAVDTLRANILAGNKGTLADLMDSPHMYGVEDKLMDVGGHEQLKRTVKALRQGQVYDVMNLTENVLPKGDTTPLTRAAKAAARKQQTKITEVDQKLTGKLAGDAEGIAKQQIELDRLKGVDTTPPSVTGAPRVSKASSGLAESTEALRKARKAEADDIWKQFDASPSMDLKADVTELTSKLDADYARNSVDLAKMKSKYKDQLDVLDQWKEGLATPADVSAVLRDLKKKTWAAKSSGTTGFEDDIARDLTKRLEKVLDTTPAAKNYQAAKQATAKIYDEVIPPNVRKALKDGNADLFAEKLTLSGTKGADAARWAKNTGDEAIKQSAQDTVRALAKREGITSGFMRKYDEFLSEFPELKDELASKLAKDADIDDQMLNIKSDIAAANKKLTADQTAINNRVKTARSAADKNTVAKFADEPDAYLRKQLTGTNKEAGIDELARLKRAAEKSGTLPELRMQVNQHISDIVFKETDGLKNATGTTITNFNKIKERLTKSGVITSDEADRISGSLERIRKLQARGKEISPAQLEETLTAFDKALASGLTVFGMQFVKSKNSLILANRLKDSANAMISSSKNKPETLQRLEEFILNPERFLKAIDATKDIDAAYSSWLKLMGRRTERGAKGLTKATTRFRQPYTPEQDKDDE